MAYVRNQREYESSFDRPRGPNGSEGVLGVKSSRGPESRVKKIGPRGEIDEFCVLRSKVLKNAPYRVVSRPKSILTTSKRDQTRIGWCARSTYRSLRPFTVAIVPFFIENTRFSLIRVRFQSFRAVSSPASIKHAKDARNKDSLGVCDRAHLLKRSLRFSLGRIKRIVEYKYFNHFHEKTRF